MPSSPSAPPVAVPSHRLQFQPDTRKVYVRETAGRFNRWRWAFALATQAVFYGLCWLPWDGRQAVLFDLAARKFYLFGLVLWPQDGIYLALLLIASAMALFFATTVAGRVFCGFACPQSVYTEIFVWIEQRIEGNRLARIRRDGAPWTLAKLRVKLAKHAAWLALAGWTGLTFVGYFTPIRTLLPAVAERALGPWESFWVLFYAGFTYVQAGFMREMVCRHMCPYARFQGVMMDAHSVSIAYDALRGEPRASAPSRHAQAGAAFGDCVDCGLCTQVCPAGIDIRKGAQYECVNCGLCADACDRVMDKLGRARGLIRMASESELAVAHACARTAGAPPVARGLGPWSWTAFARAMPRPRVLLYGGLTAALVALACVLLAGRVPLRVDLLRDRGVLAREDADGRIENVYLLKILNLRESPRRFRASAAGLPGLEIAGPSVYAVPAGEVRTVALTLRAARDAAPGMRPARVTIEDIDAPEVRAVEGTTFLVP